MAILAIICGIMSVGLVSLASVEDLDDLALKGKAIAIYGRYDDDPIHCQTIAKASDCLKPALQRRLPRRVVWIGNSQLHAINQSSPVARTAPVLLAEHLRPRGIEVLALSQPNASLQEHRILVEFLFQKFAPAILVLPLVFDDTREDSIREEMRPGPELGDVIKGLQGTGVGDRLAELQRAEGALAAAGSPEYDTLQKTAESKLDAVLAGHFPPWQMRADAKAKIWLSLYQFRNSVFGITPSSKRRLIPGAYRRNMEALDGILARAQQAGVRVIIYIAPLRNDVEPPYIITEYERFKTETEALATRYGATFLNLEDLVPAPLWGTKAATTIGGDPELDFMHFQEDGHVLLEKAIAAELGVAQ